MPRRCERRELLGYGLLGLPLAFVALPLYVLLPNHYAREYGLPLAALGAVLLAARAIDAIADPWIGRWVDRLQRRSARLRAGVRLRRRGPAGAGLHGLFLPPVREPGPCSPGRPRCWWSPTWATARPASRTSPGARCWAATRCSAAASPACARPGAGRRAVGSRRALAARHGAHGDAAGGAAGGRVLGLDALAPPGAAAAVTPASLVLPLRNPRSAACWPCSC
jgi:hypothetical protein